MVRKICVFSGNRAEYGLLSPIIKKLNSSKKINCKFIVSGSHLDKNFGKTITEIKTDGIKVYSTLTVPDFDQKKYSFTPISISYIIKKVSELLEKIKPEFMIIYADRFESFAAAVASSQMGIPTIHIEGGDITEGGTLDDNVRHAISKISHLHFTTNEKAKKLLLQMGEEKWRVKNFGSSAIDYIKNKNYASKKEIETKLKVKLKSKIVVFTFHPTIIDYRNLENQIKTILKSLIFIANKKIQIIITFPNSDFGSIQIIKHLKKIKHRNIFITKSLGRYYYHGIFALNLNSKNQVCCVGNSSSGIKETSIFKIPVVNIGDRQKGRLRSSNIFDVKLNYSQIKSKILDCFFSKKIKIILKNTKNIYGSGNTSQKILKYLIKLNISKQKLLKKKFILD